MPGESEYATVNTLFREGKAAATIGGPWLVPAVREAGIDLGLAPMPVIDETGLPLAPYSGVQGLHVLKVAADNPAKHDALGKVLKQLLNTDIGVSTAKASGCAPAFAACYDLDEIKNDEMVMMMRETALTAVPMPNIPEMDVMWNVAGNMLVDINMRKKDISASADAAQKQAEELIAAMK
jgi:arabinogalactan oligomer/maltooligosaccharide transport system substrate-binding protein